MELWGPRRPTCLCSPVQSGSVNKQVHIRDDAQRSFTWQQRTSRALTFRASLPFIGFTISRGPFAVATSFLSGLSPPSRIIHDHFHLFLKIPAPCSRIFNGFLLLKI